MTAAVFMALLPLCSDVAWELADGYLCRWSDREVALVLSAGDAPDGPGRQVTYYIVQVPR